MPPKHSRHKLMDYLRDQYAQPEPLPPDYAEDVVELERAALMMAANFPEGGRRHGAWMTVARMIDRLLEWEDEA